MNLDWKKNLGNADRMIRVIIGVILMGLAYLKTLSGWTAAIAIIIALSQFVEAYFSY